LRCIIRRFEVTLLGSMEAPSSLYFYFYFCAASVLSLILLVDLFGGMSIL
jgi:hypothetical protein